MVTAWCFQAVPAAAAKSHPCDAIQVKKESIVHTFTDLFYLPLPSMPLVVASLLTIVAFMLILLIAV